MNVHRLLAGLLLFVAPVLVFAHVGADAGIHHSSAFVVGLVHPFTGFDHLAVMLAVGMWSALTTPRMWIAPAAFAALLLAGGITGFLMTGVPMVETVIAASLVVLGLLLAAQIKLPLAAGAALVGAFAVFHGLAHGAELPAAHAVTALTGMVSATLLLHVAGLAIGHFVLRANVWLPRVVGGSALVLGGAMLSGVI